MIEGLDTAKMSANDLGDVVYVLVQVTRPMTLQVDAAVEALNELVDRATSVAAVAREAYILGAKAAHEDTVEGRYKCEPGDDWDCDPRILEDAKANAGVNDGSR